GRGARRVVMGLLVGLVAGLVEEPTVVGVGLMMLGVATVAVASEEGWTTSVSQWVGRWGVLALTVSVRWVMDYVEMGRWWGRHPSSGVRRVRAAGLWVVPLGLGVVFLILFAVANPVVALWVQRGWDEVWAVCDWLATRVDVVRVGFWCFVAIGVYGVLRYRRVRWLPRAGNVARPPRVGGVEAGVGWVVRCLVVFNGVFAVQTVLDAVYLWGGEKLPAGVSYASYAHRGAYPLVATALLAGMFVLLTFRSGGAAHRSAWARRLVYVWIGQNLFLLVSTVWRIVLYVDVYSLTRLRLAAMVWVGMVGIGFGWIVWKIVRGKSNVWLWRVNVATVIGVLYVAAFVDVSGVIARFNVRHCREVSGQGVALDVGYLRGLGVEALPALEEVRGGLKGEKRAAVEGAIRELRGELKEEIADWRGWTLLRVRIAMNDGVVRRVESAGRLRPTDEHG
ncbi:MAG: DUF4153 domain-containing protein, partial [Phycisphaerae bacterium]